MGWRPHSLKWRLPLTCQKSRSMMLLYNIWAAGERPCPRLFSSFPTSSRYSLTSDIALWMLISNVEFTPLPLSAEGLEDHVPFALDGQLFAAEQPCFVPAIFGRRSMPSGAGCGYHQAIEGQIPAFVPAADADCAIFIVHYSFSFRRISITTMWRVSI